MKKTSIRQLYFYTMICNIVTFLCGVAGSVVIPILFSEWTNNDGKIFRIIIVVAVVVAFIVIAVYSLIKLIVLLKDYKSLKHHDYVSVIGKVLRFKKNTEPESGAQINNQPVIMVLDTNEEIVLDVNDIISVGEIYKFNYLKNSKIAEVVEKL